jgi:hypothetical protein
MRTAREARADLDGVSRGLTLLHGMLELIQLDLGDASHPVPRETALHVSEIATKCNGTVDGIQTLLEKCETGGGEISESSGQGWATSSSVDMENNQRSRSPLRPPLFQSLRER